MLRRDDWWRKLCLLISMVLFGLWHGATILFILFGCWHGVLLILHRQTQQVERRFDWQPSSKAWTVLSWAVTMALINLGWIFFRSSSLAEARQMLSALVSPATYASIALNPSLYLLVATVAVSYAVALFAINRLDRYAERLQASPQSRSEALTVALRDRWVWIAPIWATACVLVLTLIPHQSRAANVFLYRFF